ncbi:TetR/AcrR family transcriptional regulator [Oleisolibacter albus]|uniref:TetR/AcrR family transcriptional regulator n=1 Tax=Oleisolibacter albus TaxID=2171757 RepID=UPI000DF120AF|nr:TetR/AcrR family transcriptional regulator [Oleisolibacter albus]
MTDPLSSTASSPRRRAGRPPDPEKRSAILDAAREVFLRDGYGASMDSVAERAGVSKQTIYKHFSAKEQLFQAIIRSHCDRVLEPLLAGREVRPPREALQILGVRFLELMQMPDYGRLLRTLAAAFPQFPALGELFYEAGPRRSRAALVAYLAEMDRHGLLHLPDPALAAEQFMGMVGGSIQLGALLGTGRPLSDTERQDRAAAAVAVFMAAYAPLPLAGPPSAAGTADRAG